MRAPFQLVRGWHLEGNMSLIDKHRLLEQLRHGGAKGFFLSAMPISKYWPGDTRQLEMGFKDEQKITVESNLLIG
jgi:hypothetical protein